MRIRTVATVATPAALAAFALAAAPAQAHVHTFQTAKDGLTCQRYLGEGPENDCDIWAILPAGATDVLWDPSNSRRVSKHKVRLGVTWKAGEQKCKAKFVSKVNHDGVIDDYLIGQNCVLGK